MKKNNIILGIVVGIFVICAVTILVMAVINNKEEETVPVNIDFEALSSDIEEYTNIDMAKMEQITKDELQDDFNIKPEWVKQWIGVKPYLNVNSNMVIIIETTEESVENVIDALETFGKKYDNTWKNYLAEEYELVKNRLVGSKGNYVYFIVSDYAKDIVDLIK